MSHPKQLIDKKELTKLVKYSPQHIARLEKAGQFPKRLRLGQNRVAWLLTEVEAWIGTETNPARIHDSRAIRRPA